MLCKSTELVITGLQLWPGPLSETHPALVQVYRISHPQRLSGHCSLFSQDTSEQQHAGSGFSSQLS